MSEVRYFQNSMLDYSLGNDVESLIKNSCIWNKTIVLIDYLNANLGKLSLDISVYTGLAGIALFYRQLILKRFPHQEILKNGSFYFNKLVEHCLRHVDLNSLRSNLSVFTGSIGALMIGALWQFDGSSISSTSRQCYDEIINAHIYACDLESNMPDEALYGRTGYLNCLLTLKEANFNVPVEVIKKVVNCILKSGVRFAKSDKATKLYEHLMRSTSRRDLPMPPLMFEWYNTIYLGAAHGFAGILNTLLKVCSMYPDAIERDDLINIILPTVDWLSKLQFRSGNWPCTLEDSSNSDILVHWCHGAPGTISLMISAYKVSRNENYLMRAIAGGEDVWNRGLLRKGCGLCHGTAGSGYCLLEIYQATRDPKYLYRAFKFAEWCTDCLNRKDRLADSPFSLFEGIAGTLYFLVDMLDPMNARFPLLNGI